MKLEATKPTIIRTIILVVFIANQLLAIFGKSPLPFSDDDITNGVSSVLLIATSIWTWWKNNSFTKEAVKADEYLAELKAGNSEKSE